MSYACAEKYSSEVRDRSGYRERIVSALQLLDPQKVKELVKAKSEENKARKQAEMEAKKQFKKEAKEQEKAQKLREKEIAREMRMLERQREREAKAEERAHKKREKEIQKDLKWLEKMQDAHIKSAEKEEKGLKRRTKQEPEYYDDDDIHINRPVVPVNRINEKGEHDFAGDYLINCNDDSTVYCGTTYNEIGKWCKIQKKIVFKR